MPDGTAADSRRPLAYSYIRFSTIEQRKNDSLRRQLKKSEEYAAEKGFQMVRERIARRRACRMLRCCSG